MLGIVVFRYNLNRLGHMDTQTIWWSIGLQSQQLTAAHPLGLCAFDAKCLKSARRINYSNNHVRIFHVLMWKLMFWFFQTCVFSIFFLTPQNRTTSKNPGFFVRNMDLFVQWT